MRILALALALAAFPSAQSDDDAQAAGPRSRARIVEAWGYLRPDEQREAAEWFRFECSRARTFQQGLIDHALASSDRDPGWWPDDEPLPHFDPETHAPRQPIPRRRLALDDPKTVRTRKSLLGERLDHDLVPAWRYDWGSGELRRLVDGPDESERVFRNGLAGHPPDVDLAIALVTRTLDRGEQREKHAAFGHAYTDRDGGVYPGITLYDAWNSGARFELPDVDSLGLVHTLLDDWKRWVAPVPGSQHDALYAEIRGLYLIARRDRGLREALARVLLLGSPVLGDGYGGNVDRFHALWERYASTPARLRPDLPDVDAWQGYLADWVEVCAEDHDVMNAGKVRRATLDANAGRVRFLLEYVMDQLGAFERTERPAPPPPKPEPPPQPVPGDGR